ncbi:Rieske 2Fe-2S domain-containing protein [Lujinxingia vulgaris]|uniref:Rieske 2Fe-2S domain-containing protein n=1 Tax=Lujinxingia vulgaris TaxID=2600176 RepID=A0A5C6XDB1_9DELT|nr:Rieske 2Fe-2S domain-containing protein [Lujinxingia vulgaris]TXD40827.1 Rieske 2Fe-2S domain-containing protein [Lujinxingia vulgaris]
MATREELLAQGFEEVCGLDEVGKVLPSRVKVGERSVLLCMDGERVRAVDEICPHKSRSMAYGVIFDGKIICPHHQYAFDLETGRCDHRSAPVHVYEVVVEDERVWVRP